jgi:cell division protein FtsL
MAAMTTGLGMLGGQHPSRMEVLAGRNRELYEQQRRARRGPTPEVFFTKHIDNSRIVKADDPERRKEMRLFAAILTVLFALAIVYVWQHFASIEIGYHIESQKAEVEHLREQNRQYRLTEAQLTEPQRIDALARQLGMDAPQPGQVIRTEGLSSSDAPAVASISAPVRSAD